MNLTQIPHVTHVDPVCATVVTNSASTVASRVESRRTPAARSVGSHAALPRSDVQAARLSAIAAGDRAAMAELWSDYADRIRNLARSTARTSDADEIVQESLTKVWKAAATFDPQRGTEATFVFTIARRAIIDRWRRQRSRPLETDLDERMTTLADAKSADAYDLVHLRDTVREAMAALTAAQREVVELAYFRGLSQSEVAEHLQIPLGTVKTRTLAALRRLRECLPEEALA